MAKAFDLVGITVQWVPCPSRFLRRAGVGNAGAMWFDHVSTTKSNSTRSIAADPLQNAQGWGTLSGNGARKDR
jgi:hypothetical protein